MTSEDLNKWLADDRRRHQEWYAKLEDSYTEMMNDKRLPSELRKSLEAELRDWRDVRHPKGMTTRVHEDAVKQLAELDAEEGAK